MVGRNYGLRGLPYVARILIPAAFPSILTGLKIGWAFAWRTLIAAELVFGVSSGSGGLGWFIYENKNQLEIPNVFAGLFTVIVIGLIVENVVFRIVEARTVRKWGLQKRYLRANAWQTTFRRATIRAFTSRFPSPISRRPGGSMANSWAVPKAAAATTGSTSISSAIRSSRTRSTPGR